MTSNLRDSAEPLPRLAASLDLAGAPDAAALLAPALAADADAALLEAGAAAPDAVRDAAAAVRAAAGSMALLIAGSPSAAGSVGAGAVLPERGMGSAEARRLLGPGQPLGREAGSAEAAALAEGVDFVVVDWDVLGAAGVRAAAERGWAPVLARVASPDEARAAIAAGAEGVIAPAAAFAAAPAGWPAPVERTATEQTVTLDGVAMPLPTETAVTDLLADAGRSGAGWVRVNGAPVPRRAWDDRLLEPGDRVETGDH